MDQTRTSLPALLAFVAAALWGVWWMPIRWLAGQGLDGALGGLVMLSGAGAVCLIWLGVKRGAGRIGPRAWVGAALIGVAFTTYSAALSYGEVVRVILLFYLAPVWSKTIERVFLGLDWHWTSSLALGLALISGLAWSAGAAHSCSRPTGPRRWG